MAVINQNKIRRTARIVRWFSFAIMLGIFVMTAWVWALPLGFFASSGLQLTANSGVAGTLISQGYLSPGDFTTGAKINGFFISAVPMALLIFVLYQVARLMGFFAAGRYITAGSIRALALASVSLLAYPLASILSETLLILYLTMDNPEGQRLLSFSIGGGDVMTVFLGAVLLMITRAFNVEKERAEEHASIV